MALAPIGRRKDITVQVLERRFDLATDTLSQELGGSFYQLQIDSSLSPGEASVAWSTSDRGPSILSFNESIYAAPLELIVNRVIDTIPLIHESTVSPDVAGMCIINVGDEGHHPGLCYCDYRPNFLLIPDCIFLAGRGYESLREYFAASPVAWRDRRPVAFWRGSTTGARVGPLTELPRLKLCLKAKAWGSRADVGVSSIVQFKNNQERLEIESLDVLKDHVPLSALNTFKYHIDIDGNSNSWPGLIAKLYSGSPVLKVASPLGFRQWYYDRLIPWTNYVPVASDMSDLEEKLAYLESHDAEAEHIGLAGQRLALSMTLDHEIEASSATIRQALS